MKLKKILKFLNDTLKPNELKDYSLNGLQVEGNPEVKKICFAVDCTVQTIRLAAKRKADMLIVHHGDFWGKERAITGVHGKRIKALLENNISLYASHLPLDSHPKIGNNAVIARLLGVKKLKAFGKYSGATWGYKGVIEKTSFDKFVRKVESVLGTEVIKLPFGSKEITTVGIVSGAGGFALEEASDSGLDVLVTGEARHQVYGEARDLKINVLFGGHYNTEVFGLLDLKKLVEKKLRINCEFIKAPSGL